MALLSDYEVEHRLSSLEGWQRTRGGEIERDVQLADFAAGLEFIQRVGALAEQANHHPDILLHGWNKVRLTLSTHSEGGLTEADFNLARAIDGLS